MAICRYSDAICCISIFSFYKICNLCKDNESKQRKQKTIKNRKHDGTSFFHLTLTQNAKVESQIIISYEKEKGGNLKGKCIHNQVVNFGI